MKTTKSILSIAIAAAAGLGFDGHAAAATSTPDFDCNNITFSGANYEACQGSYTGNDKPEAVEVLSWDIAVGDVVSKDDNSGAGTTSALIDGVAGTSGTGSVTFLQSISDPFVLTLKLGAHWAAYMFDTDVAAGTTWDFAGGPRTGAGLSHVTYWGSNPVPAVPEPQTYALLLAGLGAIGVVARRRKQA